MAAFVAGAAVVMWFSLLVLGLSLVALYYSVRAWIEVRKAERVQDEIERSLNEIERLRQ